ncbi:MAG: heme exporter protein CcmD [Cereibacter sphaeroides]|uniref:Heme exporter protein D n=1 Tax=Cereibacter sphaeroides TaxID=1063 RepID=A0A2W5SKA9_CERSP|nr:MAG: heme exporter protein CcmD [Cereibacter sphaeroides]
MSIALGKYAAVVLGSYAAAILLLMGLVGFSLWRDARMRRALEAVEARQRKTDG